MIIISKKQERLASLTNQAERVQRRMDTLARRGRRLWQIKLAITILGFIMALIALNRFPWLAIPVICVAIASFLSVSSIHRQVNDVFIKYKTLRQIKNEQIARVQLDWENLPLQITGQKR